MDEQDQNQEQNQGAEQNGNGRQTRVVNDVPAVAVDGSMVSLVGNNQISIRFLQNVGRNQSEISMMVAGHVRLDPQGVQATINLLQDTLKKLEEAQAKQLTEQAESAS